jgi:hypothetical protein
MAEDLIKQRYILLAVLLISLLVSSYSLYVAGDVDTSTPHTDKIFYATDERTLCKTCHIGFPVPSPGEVSRFFENYRCISCHMGLDSTVTLVDALSDSPHRATGCIFCHDTLHEGHSGYSTETPGYYGCSGGNCHQIVTQDITPPALADVFFVDTYVVKNDTAPISFYIDRIRWFYDTSITGKNKRIYPNAFMDPYTGSFSDIASNKRYWACLKCHFTVQGVRSTQTSTYWVSHPDKCTSCHSNISDYPSSIFLLEPHAVKYGGNVPWNSCAVCHNGVNQSVSLSIHANVGCSCHSTLHISRYNSTGSWLYTYFSGPGLYYKPPTINLSSWKNIFHYDSFNTTVYDVVVHPVDVAGDPRYMDIYYVLRDGSASLITGPDLRFMTCFNCHFINDPSVSTAPFSNIDNLIPLPSMVLDKIKDPHSISRFTSESVSTTKGLSGLNISIILIPFVILILYVVFVFRSREA